MLRKVFNKIKYIFTWFYLKKSLLEYKNNINYSKKEMEVDFEKFLKNINYKDEHWNYILNLKEYLNSIYTNKPIELNDNIITNQKYKIIDKKIKVLTKNIDNNWICFFINNNLQNFELKYDLTIYNDFDEIQIAFKYQDLGTRYRFMIRKNLNAVFECVYKGKFYTKLVNKQFSLNHGEKYNIKLVVLNNLFSLFINNERIITIKENKQIIKGKDIVLIFFNKLKNNKINFEIDNLEIFNIV